MTDSNEIVASMDELLAELVFDPLDPDDFVCWADGVEFRGREGLQAFREKYKPR